MEKDRSFKVHKTVVCTQSKVLAAMSDSGFKESSTAILQLEHDDPATVERMLTFLYTGKYDQGSPDPGVRYVAPFIGPIFMANTLAYSIADKYEVEGLKSLAKAKFENLACAAWHCEDFPTIVAKVFDTTPDSDLGLRDVVSRICARHIDKVLASDTWTDLLSNNGAIGLAVLKFTRQRSIEEVRAAEKKALSFEGDLHVSKVYNDRLRKRFDYVREDLDSIVEKWGVNRGDEVCKECCDGLFEGLKYDLANMELPRSTERVCL